MDNLIVWAAIPATDLQRAMAFYGAGDAGALLRRAQEAGGDVITPMADMGETVGAIGFFRDSEGNRIGVHRPPGA